MGEVVSPEEPLAALLRAARTSVGRAIRSALANAGYDDLPVNGPYVMSATSVTGVPLGLIIERLGLSKQAAGHLVDLLVVRGYLDRHVDPGDRRRLVVHPTVRGTAAVQVIRRAADLIEADVVAAVGAAALETTGRTLARLATLDGEDG
jgi:DNA-binding MarR family transcriptional regulator